jgi:glucose/arabinose dehydrogenase
MRDGGAQRLQGVPAGFAMSDVASVPSPTAIEVMPDGSLVVLQQNGAVRIIDNGALVPSPALQLSNICFDGVERGLLGFTPDPGFVSNRTCSCTTRARHRSGPADA